MAAWLRRLVMDGLAWLRPLPAAQRRILRAMLAGWTLKSHRYLDGNKIYRLHSLTGEAIDLPAKPVEALRQRHLLQTNHKFPAATLLLTERGWRLASKLGSADADGGPLTARSFQE